MEKQSSVWAYMVSVFTTLFGGLTLDKFAVLVGIGATVGTFAVNWYYRAQENARAKERHEKGE